jgi:glycosyltransferase involved in cell wall biosynthesis
MDNTPLVSFIVPVRNGESTIHACLTSILNQTSQLPFEIIIIDNLSKDKSAQIASEMGLEVILEKNVGRSSARNRGLSVARGEWIAFVDCDVELERNWLEEMHTDLILNNLDGGQGPIIPATNKKCLFQTYRMALINFQTRGEFIQLHDGFIHFPLINSAACLYRRSALIQVQGFDESLDGFEDADLAWRMWLNGAIWGVAKDARAKVYFLNGTFLSYFHRAWRMGKESAILYQLWRLPFIFGIHLCPKSFSNSLLLRSLENIRRFIFFSGFYLSQNRRTLKSRHSRNLKSLKGLKVISHDLKKMAYISGKTRFAWTKNGLLIKDCEGQKKTTIKIERSPQGRDDIPDILKSHLQELHNNGFDVFSK